MHSGQELAEQAGQDAVDEQSAGERAGGSLGEEDAPATLSTGKWGPTFQVTPKAQGSHRERGSETQQLQILSPCFRGTRLPRSLIYFMNIPRMGMFQTLF